jgi:hypothetical protein
VLSLYTCSTSHLAKLTEYQPTNWGEHGTRRVGGHSDYISRNSPWWVIGYGVLLLWRIVCSLGFFPQIYDITNVSGIWGFILVSAINLCLSTVGWYSVSLARCEVLQVYKEIHHGPTSWHNWDPQTKIFIRSLPPQNLFWFILLLGRHSLQRIWHFLSWSMKREAHFVCVGLLIAAQPVLFFFQKRYDTSFAFARVLYVGDVLDGQSVVRCLATLWDPQCPAQAASVLHRPHLFDAFGH